MCSWLLLSAGCNAPAIDQYRPAPVAGFAGDTSPNAQSNFTPAGSASRVIRIEPEPERDAQVDALVKSALDDLRSGQIQEALDLLTQAQSIEGWMRSEHAPAVLFWTGHAYDQLGERNAAMAAFRRITIQYPRSAFADRASRRLRELRGRSPQSSS